MFAQQPRTDSFPRTERRRSQRSRVEAIPIEVTWHNKDGIEARRRAQAEVVSAHGALLWVEHELPVRQIVALVRGSNREWTMARVVHCGLPSSDGWTPVAVELAVPNEAFWGCTDLVGRMS